MQFEQETAPEFSTNVAAPTIQRVAVADEDADHAFTVKVAPAAGNTYYSFAILKGDSALDGETILENGYSSKAVTVKLVRDSVEVDVPLSGCFDAKALKDTTVNAFKLDPNTKYTVYAVGCDELGILSKVTTLTITTSDVTIPSIFNAKGAAQYDDSKLEDGTIVIKFDDPVEFTDDLKNGKAKFYASYLGVNEKNPDGSFAVQFTEEIPLDSLTLDGNIISIQVPERIPGAVVGISFDAGVVVNGVNLKNDKTECSAGYNDKGEVDGDGIISRFDTAPFEFALPVIEDEAGNLIRMPEDTIIYVQDWEAVLLGATAQDLVEPQYQEGKTFNFIVAQEAPEIRYTDGDLRKVIYPASTYETPTDTTLVCILDENPGFGVSIAIDIAEGAIEDLWGNPCESFSSTYVDEDGNPFYGNYFTSYGFNLEDVFGTYTFAAVDSEGAPYVIDSVIIAPREPFENPVYEEYYAERNVEIHNLFSGLDYSGFLNPYVNYNPILYGTFNIHSGLLNIEYEYLGEAGFASYGWAGYVIVQADTEDNNYNFKQAVAGTLIQQEGLYIVLDGLGAIDYLIGGKLEKTGSDYALTPAVDEGANSPSYVPLSKKRNAAKTPNTLLKK